MIRILALLTILLVFSDNLHAQKGKKKKELKGQEADDVMKQLFADSTIFLRNAGQQACTCIDSIDNAVADKDEKLAGFAECIDQQTSAYQLAEKLLGASKGTSREINLNINKESTEYKLYYYRIESWVRDSCRTVNRVINENNDENEKSFSQNTDARAAYDEGLVFLRKEEFEKALPYFKRAVEIDKAFVFAWDNLGICYRRTGNLDQAEAAYKASLAIDSTGKMALQNLAVVYQYQKKWDDAVEMYKKILQFYPGDPEVYYGLGIIYFDAEKNMEEALQNMCKAYNIYVQQKSPFRSDAEKLINRIYSEMKKDNKEERFYQILKENNINPNNK